MNNRPDPIRGKVARILTTRELALNIGASAGVKVGMRFDVLDPKGENITDPETGKVLGSVERPKVRVKVTEVKDQLSIAATFRHKTVIEGSGFGSSQTFVDLLTRLPRTVKRYETLKTTEKTWEDLDEHESYVKTGDPVVQVLEEEEAPEA